MRAAALAGSVLFAAAALVPIGYFGARHLRGDDSGFLPGRTSDGHHPIETRCQSCHTPFAGVRDDSCRDCHEASLRARGDSHAPFKFADPGKAAMLRVVDARSCVPCHREHRPEARLRGSVTVATTFCIGCHPGVASERPSHRAFAASSCADAGCHNYHDNRALQRDYLSRHRGEPDLLADRRVPVPAAVHETNPWRLEESDAIFPAAEAVDAKVVAAWAASAHAAAEVNCGGCHQPDGAVWSTTVADQICAGCHRREQEGFRAGKHGMRLAARLSPLSPALARAPMRADATGTLGCTTCHGAHTFDRVTAAVDACEACHADTHTRNYRGSPHHEAWRKEQTGEAAAGTGVSCATCHLPRLISRRKGEDVVAVQHNNNHDLRPSTRMVVDVCARCHGVGFALAALADDALVDRNFNGPPRPTLTGMDLVEGEPANEKR